MNLFHIASDIFEEKMKAALSTYFHGKMDKKKVKEIFNDLYVRQEGQALFENQGFAEGIDFYVLSDKLRADIIENVLSYYNEIDRKKAKEIKHRLYNEAYAQVGAITDTQKKTVSLFLDRIYELTGFYMLKCLGKEDRVAIIISDEHMDQQLKRIKEEIQRITNKLESEKIWEIPIDDFRSYHQRQKNCNGAYRLLHINDMLFPALSAWDGVCYSNEDGDLVPLYNCLTEEWESPERQHILLIGAGGMGKTVSLLRLWDKQIEDGVCTLYIPLHEVMGGGLNSCSNQDVIKGFITENIWFGNIEKTEQFIAYLSNGAGTPMFILLLDGFNEISEQNKRLAVSIIKKWMQYPRVQIVISSRYDFRKDIAVQMLKEVKIEPLSEQQIKKWFGLCKISFPEKDKKLQELLKTPFMLTLYTQVESRYNQGKDAIFIQWMEPVNTSSNLMWNFLQCQILKMANDFLKSNMDILKAVVASMYILPYICWKMEWEEMFTIEIGELQKWVEEAIEVYKNKWELSPEPWIQILEIELGKIEWDNNNFLHILIKEVNLLMKYQNISFSLLHQNFRDFLAAVFLYYVIKADYKEIVVKTWEKQPFSDRIIIFLSEWMPETDADNMFQSLRNQQIPDGNYIFFNLMRVIRKIKKDDLSNMDFSNMDLRTVQLNGARLVNGKCCANFRNAKINYGTLIMQGHHDKIYYIAFSEDGQQIISASAFEIRIWDISTGSCIHEITQGIQQLNGDFEYNQPKYYRKFITADGNEFVWVGENDICAGMFIECFATLFSCDNGWKEEIELFKKESSFGWKKARKKQLEIILKYRINTGDIVIQEDRIIVSLPGGKEKILSGNQALVTSATLSKDIKYCVAGLVNGSICIWDLEKEKIIKEFPRSTHQICCVNGCSELYIGQTTGIAMIWDSENKVCNYVLQGRNSPVTAISIADKENICIVSHKDDVAEVWDLKENRIIRRIKQHQYVHISYDGVFLCGKTSDGTVWCYNQITKDGRIVWIGLDRDKEIGCSGYTIYMWSNNYNCDLYKQFNMKERIYTRYSRGYDNYPRVYSIQYQHNLVSFRKPYDWKYTKSVYVIININLCGCDFTGASFETLELAVKVKSNGGIVEIPEEYYTRLYPWYGK